MKTSLHIFAALFLLGFAGCELGVHPLVFDGTATSDPVWVNTPFQIVAAQQTVNLADARFSDQHGSSFQVDSVRFYNLSVLIDSSQGTPAGTTLTGILKINNDTLATMFNVPLAAFTPERSIFDRSLAGWRFSDAGVRVLIQALRNPNPPSVTFSFGAFASNSPISFRARIKVHAQVYTNP